MREEKPYVSINIIFDAPPHNWEQQTAPNVDAVSAPNFSLKVLSYIAIPVDSSSQTTSFFSLSLSTD